MTDLPHLTAEERLFLERAARSRSYAECRTAVPALLAEVSRLRGALKKIRDDETDHCGAGRRIHKIARAAIAPKPVEEK